MAPEQLAPAPGAVCSSCVQMGVASDEWGPSGLFQDISWWFLFVLPSNALLFEVVEWCIDLQRKAWRPRLVITSQSHVKN